MRDAGCPDYLSALVANRRKRDVHGDPRAVLADALGGVVLDGLAPHYLSCDSGDFFGTLWRTQNVNRHTDCLGGRVSVELFRSTIPTGNDSVYVAGEDGIVGGFDH